MSPRVSPAAPEAQAAPRPRRRALAGLLLALLLAAPSAACDTTRDVVDAANPVGWFEGDDEDANAGAETAKAPPGADEDFPALGTTPDRPAEPEIKSRFEELRSGLVADRENAQYSDEVIRRTPPPDRARADAAMAALQAPPSEPPTAEGVASQPGEGDAIDTPIVAPEPAPSQTATAGAAPAVPADAPSETPQAAPAPEPLTRAQAAEAPQQPAEPPASAAPMAAETPSAPVERDAPAANSERLIATIYFPNGGAGLAERDRDILRQVADIYSRGGASVRVVGHSSQDGAEAGTQKALVNYKTSLDRASAVAGALAEYGVPRDAISIDARGASELRYAESTAAGVAGNRRAEVYVTF
ncbi:MAG: OmpA family protein [Marivibrio sp.]|uniref:OmpA family protein n=1 Tax=Marivibrio sp. TaxID=2039719 RepID=UPI0032EC721B